MTSAGQSPKELCEEISKVWHCEDGTETSSGSCMCEEPSDYNQQNECEKEGKTWDCGDANSGTVATCVCKDIHNEDPEKKCEEEGKVWTCGEGENANACQCEVAHTTSAITQTNDAAKEQCQKDHGVWDEDEGKCKEGTQMTP